MEPVVLSKHAERGNFVRSGYLVTLIFVFWSIPFMDFF